MSRAAATLQSALQALQQGQGEQACSMLLPLAQREPRNAEIAFACASALVAVKQIERAAYFFDRASQLSAGDAATQSTIAETCIKASLVTPAIAAAKRAVAAEPDLAHAHVLHARAAKLLQVSDAYERGLAILRAATEAWPRNAELHAELAKWLFAVGRADECLTHARAAVFSATAAIDTAGGSDVPIDRGLACGLASHINYAEHETPESILVAHRAAGAAIAAAAPVLPPLQQRLRNSARPITIGLVSPNFHRHSVSYFLRPILRHLDRQRFRVLAYADHPPGGQPDEVTSEFRELTQGWCDTTSLSDEALATRVREDAVDVLIDLAGHTAGDRLGVFAARAAPVQITAIGYPNTTGVPNMDWRLVDALTDPPGFESHASERLLQMSQSGRGCFLCYTPGPEAEVPPAPPPPCTRDASAPITYGSFNTQIKVTPGTLDTWARLLHAVTGSRLVLKNHVLNAPAEANFIRHEFKTRGIAPERLTLRGVTAGRREHLEAYADVDIALDTFPYHGTTTTCEALLMGVPVITRAGDRHASRVGVSLLSAVGLQEFIARDADDFIRLAATLTADRPRLASLRSELRPRLLSSPLCDAKAYAARFAQAIEHAWSSHAS